MKSTRVAVIGMGYVGIPAAVLFADVPGFQVVGVQRRSPRSGWKIDLLNQGGSPFPETEPEIGGLIRRVALEKKSFRVTDRLADAAAADAILIDVQTPVEADHVPRYESLKEVAAQIGRQLRKSRRMNRRGRLVLQCPQEFVTARRVVHRFAVVRCNPAEDLPESGAPVSLLGP